MPQSDLLMNPFVKHANSVTWLYSAIYWGTAGAPPASASSQVTFLQSSQTPWVTLPRPHCPHHAAQQAVLLVLPYLAARKILLSSTYLIYKHGPCHSSMWITREHSYFYLHNTKVREEKSCCSYFTDGKQKHWQPKGLICLGLKILEKCKRYPTGIFSSNPEPSCSSNSIFKTQPQVTHGICDRGGNSVQCVLRPSNVGAPKHPQACVCTPLTCPQQGRPGLGAFCRQKPPLLLAGNSGQTMKGSSSFSYLHSQPRTNFL